MFLTRIYSCLPLAIPIVACLLWGCRNQVGPSSSFPIKGVTNIPSPVAASKTAVTDTAGYKVYQIVRPQMSHGSGQVIISVLQDARLRGLTSVPEYFPHYHAVGISFESDEQIFDGNNITDYKHAVLLITRANGSLISRRVLDVLCALIDTIYLDERKLTVGYLYTEDFSIGWGSYNGPASRFVCFTDTGMVSYPGDNCFAKTLKSAWVIRYAGNHLEVWSKRCRPADNDDFEITTEKSVFTGDSFKAVKVVKKGYWEDDGESIGEFLSSFPR